MLNRHAATIPFLALLLVLGFAGCAAKPIGYSDFDKETDFSGYQTFSWISARPLVVATTDAANPALETFLKEEVQANLTRRGFRYVQKQEDADFVIGFTAGSRDTMHTTVYRQDYRTSWMVGGWTYSEVGAFSQDSTEGGIVIDIFDRAKAEKKWMGRTIKELSMNDRIELQETVREVVDIILEQFPPA